MWTSARRKQLSRLILFVATVVGALSTSRLWSFEGLEHAQIEAGYFEDRRGDVKLTLHMEDPDEVLHKSGLDERGRVSMPPGAVIAAPLFASSSYRVSADNGVPYIAIGAASVDENRAMSYNSRILGPAYTLEARGESFDELVPWNLKAPWWSDEQRLEALKTACHLPPGSGDLEVTRRGGSVDLKLGTCSKTLTLDPEAMTGAGMVLVVVAGPTWSFLEQTDAPLIRRRV